MHLTAEGGVHDDPPVAQLVAEPLDHQGAVVGHVPGGLLLLAQVGDEVVGRPVVEACHPGALACRVVGQPGDLAQERADGAPELRRPAERVAVPERQLARLPGRRRHEHPVVRDLLDAPRRRAEGEDVADPRLVHHLLVELADPAPGPPPRLVTAGEEHSEQPPVGDRAAAGDGEPLGARPAGERAGEPVPHQPRTELGELVARVTARQHVEHGLEHAPPEGGERRRPLDDALELVDLPGIHRDHRDDLLGQHVERVRRYPERLDPPVAHALHDDGRLHEVAAVLGEQHAAGHGPDLVPRTPDALQPAGHARRGLHLDDEVDRAHVDAELEARGGDDGGQPPGLQLALDDRPLLLADRAVVGPREHGRCARRRPRLRHERGRRDGARLGQLGQLGLLLALVPDLVEPRGQPLGEPAGVGEHERGVVLRRRGRPRAPRRAARSRAGGAVRRRCR